MSLKEIELQQSLDRRDERITELEKQIESQKMALAKCFTPREKRVVTSCWSPGTKNCDCPACGGFND